MPPRSAELDDFEVEALSPEEFLKWWRKNWKPGQHVFVAGMTGSGKSTCIIYLCGVRKFVAALDAKGLDRTLSASGWERIKVWPPPYHIKEQIKNGDPTRIIIGKKANNTEQFEANAALLRKSVRGIWAMGNFTVDADEGQILADSRYVGAGADLEKMMIAARDRGVSLIFATQRPAVGQTAPSIAAAMSQCEWVAVSRTRDRRVHDRLAEILGRPAQEVRALISSLPKFTWAMVGLDPYEPIRLVQPPEIKVPPPGKPVENQKRSWFV
jgi:energy-coupling factor transporter ATP-binding protein EcfA2